MRDIAFLRNARKLCEMAMGLVSVARYSIKGLISLFLWGKAFSIKRRRCEQYYEMRWRGKQSSAEESNFNSPLPAEVVHTKCCTIAVFIFLETRTETSTDLNFYATNKTRKDLSSKENMK